MSSSTKGKCYFTTELYFHIIFIYYKCPGLFPIKHELTYQSRIVHESISYHGDKALKQCVAEQAVMIIWHKERLMQEGK